MRNVNYAIENLKSMPKMHVVIKNHSELEMEHRKIVINNYVIIYTVNEMEKKVYIVNMYYKGRNYFLWLGEG